MGVTSLTLAAFATVWLVPPYLLLMAWIVDLPRVWRLRARPVRGRRFDAGKGSGRGEGSHVARWNRPKHGRSLGEPTADHGDTTDDADDEPNGSEDALRADDGTGEATDPEESSALSLLEAAGAKPRRGRGKGRKAKTAAEAEPAPVTWVRVGPGKFVRSDTPGLQVGGDTEARQPATDGSVTEPAPTPEPAEAQGDTPEAQAGTRDHGEAQAEPTAPETSEESPDALEASDSTPWTAGAEGDTPEALAETDDRGEAQTEPESSETTGRPEAGTSEGPFGDPSGAEGSGPDGPATVPTVAGEDDPGVDVDVEIVDLVDDDDVDVDVQFADDEVSGDPDGHGVPSEPTAATASEGEGVENPAAAVTTEWESPEEVRQDAREDAEGAVVTAEGGGDEEVAFEARAVEPETPPVVQVDREVEGRDNGNAPDAPTEADRGPWIEPAAESRSDGDTAEYAAEPVPFPELDSVPGAEPRSFNDAFGWADPGPFVTGPTVPGINAEESGARQESSSSLVEVAPQGAGNEGESSRREPEPTVRVATSFEGGRTRLALDCGPRGAVSARRGRSGRNARSRTVAPAVTRRNAGPSRPVRVTPGPRSSAPRRRSPRHARRFHSAHRTHPPRSPPARSFRA